MGIRTDSDRSVMASRVLPSAMHPSCPIGSSTRRPLGPRCPRASTICPTSVPGSAALPRQPAIPHTSALLPQQPLQRAAELLMTELFPHPFVAVHTHSVGPGRILKQMEERL